MYEVRMPNTSTFRIDGTKGAIISRHRSLDAARTAIEKEQRAVRRRPGGQSSFVQRYVSAPDGEIVWTSGC